MDNNRTFQLEGSYDQRIILVSAVRYAWGRHTYMPSSTCEIITKHIGELDPATAYIIARDIRNEWCTWYDAESRGGTNRERDMFYSCDVQPFVDILPLLDVVSRPVLTEQSPYMSEPQPPAGYRTWDEVPEEVRYRWPVKKHPRHAQRRLLLDHEPVGKEGRQLRGLQEGQGADEACHIVERKRNENRLPDDQVQA